MCSNDLNVHSRAPRFIRYLLLSKATISFMIKVRIVMAPCSSSFASLNLSAESFPAGQSYRDTHICREQAAAAWWHSLLSVRSVTSSQILNLPITTINARVRPLPLSTALVTVTGRWSRDEPTINHQTWIIKRLLRAQACKKMSFLAKAGEGFGWEMTHSRYREQRALSLCARSDLWFHPSWSDMGRCWWVGGWSTNKPFVP